MVKFWDDFYVKAGNRCQSPYTEIKHKKLIEIIPKDTSSILDAGCGGGALMALLEKENKYQLEGVDLSSEGVRFVTEELGMKAQVGDVTNLHQYQDNSFDMIICSEVLEHLPINKLEKAVKELARVSKKYVVLTNPFSESLTYHQLCCDHCLTRYHPAGHIHSIDESFMKPVVSKYAKSVSFHYSGKKPYASLFYASFLRFFGCTLMSYETQCPVCETMVQPKKWSNLIRVSGHVYSSIQKLLKSFGVFRPANIITFVDLKKVES